MKDPKDIQILIGCEESGIVTECFRNLGFSAFSCDILPTSGNHPEWHYQQDIFEVINMRKWDVLIGHPPCTFTSYAGNRWLNIDRYGERAIERHKNKDEAISFFKKLWKCDIPLICLENPKGYIMKEIPYTQLIQPYYFGDECSKTTLLWLKGLPKLLHSKSDTLFYSKTHVYKGAMTKTSGSELLFGAHTFLLSKAERSKLRSKTFPGIAKNMAQQWGEYLLNQ